MDSLFIEIGALYITIAPYPTKNSRKYVVIQITSKDGSGYFSKIVAEIRGGKLNRPGLKSTGHRKIWKLSPETWRKLPEKEANLLILDLFSLD